MSSRSASPYRSETQVVVLDGRVPGGRRRLTRDLSRLAARIAHRHRLDLSLTLTLVGDERIAELNARFAGHAGPTDVLAFPLAEEPVLTGDVVVSVETARREALRRGHPAYDELLLYVVHGALHLVGHDDHDPVLRRRMRRAERDALGALGIRPVFSRKGRPSP